MIEPKFNFIPAQHSNAMYQAPKRYVTIQTKSSYMTFSTKDGEAQYMIDKYLEFFVDTEKNVLGWKLFKNGSPDQLKYLRKVTQYETVSGDKTIRIIRVPLGSTLKTLKHDQKSYKKLEIKKYKKTGLEADGETIYYVEIPKK